jgi:hypothetical protein
LGRIDIASNDPHEAYTGNSMGRKEARTLLKQFSLVTAYAGGHDVKMSEAYTKGSIRGRDPGGPAGVREHGT